MKNNLKIAVVAGAVVAFAVLAPAPAAAGGYFGMHIGTGGFGVSVGIGDWGPYTDNWTNAQWSLDFNTALSGYGEWVWVGNLGRVWRPWVAAGWQPYTYGRWIRTPLGWTWVAYEPWGYVPHHYGSWAMCDFGWAWVPGYTYSTANVVWVRSAGYVGWYARPPRGWSHAARGYRHGYRDGYRDGWRDARYATYVDWHHMGSDNVSHYAVRHSLTAPGRVEVSANPPSADELRRRGGISVPEAQISQRTVTMNGRRVSIARPEGIVGSIERHAAGTAAEALSPRALERRQPAVRPGPSRRHSESSVQSSGGVDSHRRRLPGADGSRSARAQAPGGPPPDIDTRSSGRGIPPRVSGEASRDRSPGRAQPDLPSRWNRPVAPSTRGGRVERSTSIEPRRNPISARSAGADRSRAPSRTEVRPSSRIRSTAARPGLRSQPATRTLPERSPGPDPSARADTGRTTREAQRRTAARNHREAEAKEKDRPRPGTHRKH